MSVESLAAVLHHSRAKGTAKLILVGIANHDGDGGAYPAVATLARYANCDPRSVQRALDKLVSIGELVVQVQNGGTRDTPDHRRPNRYLIRVVCPPWCDRSTQHRDTRETHQPGLIHTGDTGVTPPGSWGDTGVTPPGDTGVTQTIPTNHTNAVSTQVQYAREACEECSARDELVCTDRQRRLSKADRHTYRPRTRHAGR